MGEKKKAEPASKSEEKAKTSYEVKTHTDADFRFPKTLLERLGFGSRALLSIEVKEITPGEKVVLAITKKAAKA